MTVLHKQRFKHTGSKTVIRVKKEDPKDLGRGSRRHPPPDQRYTGGSTKLSPSVNAVLVVGNGKMWDGIFHRK